MTHGTRAESVDAYIATFPTDVQAILQQVRATVRAAAPDAVESIAYGMPAYKLKGKPLVYFGAHTTHLGFYPTPEGMGAFEEALAPYKGGKGSAKFPFDQPIPYDLIARITAHRAAVVK